MTTVAAGDILQAGGVVLELRTVTEQGKAAWEALSDDERERVKAQMSQVMNDLAVLLSDGLRRSRV